jgi:hypothetical protein
MVEDVLSTDRLIEAPNWMPDASALLVNGDGRMFRVPLDAPALVEIDTGHAVECNNDHGISPDGCRMVISDSTDTGESCIWVLPVAGGTPRRDDRGSALLVARMVPRRQHARLCRPPRWPVRHLHDRR